MNGRIELYLHSREMLRSIIPNLSFWIHIFEFGIADVNFPPCIRIKGDIHQDIDTNRIIDQNFAFNKRSDKPDIPRYISSDGKYSFKYNEEFDANFQWFLVERGANLNTAYLKTPAPSVGTGLSKNPFMLADCAWKIYTDTIWQSVTYPINVESCEQSKQQGQQTIECEPNQGLESTQSNNVQVSEPSISPSTISHPDAPASTVQMTIKSMPECIRLKADVKFLEDNNYEQIKIESILKVLLKLTKVFK